MMKKLLPALTVALLGAYLSSAAIAQNAPTEDAPHELRPEPVQTTKEVTITGSRRDDIEQRRFSTAAKQVYGREELDRNGDSTVGEILKRLPGVTIGGRPGRSGDIRMRGLGSGYTQVLVNGERPPRGFSLDSLAPDQIERIEIYRAPVAEFSTQAIAGTINIVLSEDFRQTQTQVRIADGIEQGRNAPSLSVTHPGKTGALTYLLSGSIFQNRRHNEIATETTGVDPLGQTELEQHLASESMGSTRGVHLTPRFSYRFDGGDTLVLQPFLTQSHTDTAGVSRLDQRMGPPPPYASADSNSRSDNAVQRLFGNWQHRFQNGGKLEVKFGTGQGRADSETLSRQYDSGGVQRDLLLDTSATKDRSASTGGKYTTRLGENHLAAFGWDAEWNRRNQTRVSLDNGAPQFFDSGENLSARTRRLATFMQDEWDITPQWSTYMGLRWEGIATASTTSNGDVSNGSSVWSPILQGLWRIPGREKDQVRMSVTHSYRAPALADLIALPVLSHLNSPTSPDRIGNPNLKPELSTGLDFAFEHYLTGGVLSTSAFSRNIDDLMRRRISLQGGRWLSQPLNIGHATTRGIELEAKFQMREFFPGAPAIDVRSNYSRFWSRVDDVPGPDNRLDQQPSQTGNFGIDYRVAGVPLTLGGNLNWTPAYIVQASESQTSSTGVKRQMDIYGLWKFNPQAQLRLSANNLTHGDYLTGSNVTLGGVNQSAEVTAKTYATWTLRLELKI